MFAPLIALALLLTSQAGGLKIVVIAGEDAVNIIQQKTATAPIVEVRDRNNLPVPGAIVTFSIEGGKAASFGGASSLSIATNAAGQAAATGLSPVASGALQINVSAAFQGQTIAATIAQTNVMTAAEAAAAASASSASSASGGSGASGASSASGAAGGGGGISGATVGIVGAAVGGGAIAATQVVGKESGTTGPSGPTGSSTNDYLVSYTGTLVSQFTNTSNSPTCNVVRTIIGTLSFTLIRQGFTGTPRARLVGTDNTTGGTCGGEQMNTNFDRGTDVTVAGAAVSFRVEQVNTRTANGGTETSKSSYSFEGALSPDNSSISGSLLLEEGMVFDGPAPVRSSGQTRFALIIPFVQR